MAELFDREPDVIVSGTLFNQGGFYPRFAFVVLLSAPVEVLIQRVMTRTNNPYGSSPQQQAGIELDGCRPLTELLDAVEALGS